MKFTYCTACGGKLYQEDETTYHCKSCSTKLWNNPKAAAGVILLQDKQVLVAKRAREPQKGKYDFPGGFLDYNEDAEDAARRELLEEAGIKLGNLELIATSTHEYAEGTSSCDLLFLATDWEGDIRPNDDVAELYWKPLDFINSPQFAWAYPGLAHKVAKRL